MTEPPPEINRTTSIFGLLRHGQTEWNVLKKIQGSRNSPLTDQGKAETREWAKTLKNYNWDHIIASDLGRVRQTVAILNEKLHVPATFHKELREQDWGEWEGMTIAAIKKNFPKDLARRIAMGWDFAAPGGESRSRVRERVLGKMLETAENTRHKKILVICHQGVIKTVLYHLTRREFLPGEDPLLQHNRFHLLSCNDRIFSPLELNIPRDSG